MRTGRAINCPGRLANWLVNKHPQRLSNTRNELTQADGEGRKGKRRLTVISPGYTTQFGPPEGVSHTAEPSKLWFQARGSSKGTILCYLSGRVGYSESVPGIHTEESADLDCVLAHHLCIWAQAQFCFVLFFNWKIIALQCCAGFCHTTTRISHNYILIYIPSLTSLSPTPRKNIYLAPWGFVAAWGGLSSPDQGSNPSLLHCKVDPYPLDHQGSP